MTDSSSQGDDAANQFDGPSQPPTIQLQCPHCAASLQIDAIHAGNVASCPHCKGNFQVPVPVAKSQQPSFNFSSNYSEVSSKKLAAGLCGIFVGTFGVHKFILGYNNAGIIMLSCSIAGIIFGTCLFVPIVLVLVMQIIGLIEGIIYLTKTDYAFEQTYIQQKRDWF